MTSSGRSRRRLGREYGRGSIEKRNGKWWVRYSEGTGAERRQHREGPFDSEAEAEFHRGNGRRLSESALQPADEWLLDWAEKQRQELRQFECWSTAKQRPQHVKGHIAPGVSGLRLGELCPAHFSELWADLAKQGLGEHTIRNIRSTASVAMRHAVSKGILTMNPVRDSEMPPRYRGAAKHSKAPTRPKRVTGALDVTALARVVRWALDNIASEPWALPVLIIALTGMRRAECLGLTWGAVDWEARTLNVEQQVVEDDEAQLHLGVPKSATSMRIIAIPKLLLRELRAFRDRTATEHDDGALIFVDRHGQARIPDSLSQWFRRRLRRTLDLPVFFTPHCLRHTHQTLMEDLKVSDKQRRYHLGHAPETVAERYSHGSLERDHKTVRKLMRALKPPLELTTGPEPEPAGPAVPVAAEAADAQVYDLAGYLAARAIRSTSL